MKSIICLFFLVWCSLSRAQAPEPCRCAWWQNDSDYYAMIVSHNLIGGPGPWIRWHCYAQAIPEGATSTPGPAVCTIAQPWAAITLTKIGDRLETIRAAPDWKAAARPSWKRHVTLPLSDPSLTEMREAIGKDLLQKAGTQ
jgi:hypothetical protein